MACIAVIDDKELLRDSLAACLKRAGYEVEAFDAAAAALERLGKRPFDLIITDLKMPEMDGIAFLNALRERAVEVPVILMTAFGTIQTAVEAMKLGAFDYIQKPFDSTELTLLAERAIALGQLRRENEAWRRSLADARQGRELIGRSDIMKGVFERINLVSASDATVLIQGESGTGKELVARAIHAASPRGQRPMLCLNCPALSEHLLESELFGHEKGAFTGADKARKGRFELANGGTLLLDEISEIPPRLQGKLLRVLQEREFERVGSSITQRVDVRVIATTNRDLKSWVSRGRFREDLYYRLSVLPIDLPPLRARPEDVEALAHYFLGRRAKQQGVPQKQLTRAAIEAMKSYHWPGNVRELENLMERVCVLHHGTGKIDRQQLTVWFDPGKASDGVVSGLTNVRDGHMLEDMERQLVERTLSRYNGHREKTAKALGIGVRTLGMKLKRWRSDPPVRRAG